MVIIQMIAEKLMGYRGSKSDFTLESVKEQRVDGSWYNKKNLMYLRYTLMGFERNYQVKIPSNHLFKTSYSTLVDNISTSNPWFITGFADAESSFSILIQNDPKFNLNWRVKPLFTIGLNVKDIFILKTFKDILGVGNIHTHGISSIQYRVDSFQDLETIINHFDTHPLITAKLSDYILFKKAFLLIKQRQHLNS